MAMSHAPSFFDEKNTGHPDRRVPTAESHRREKPNGSTRPETLGIETPQNGAPITKVGRSPTTQIAMKRTAIEGNVLQIRCENQKPFEKSLRLNLVPGLLGFFRFKASSTDGTIQAVLQRRGYSPCG